VDLFIGLAGEQDLLAGQVLDSLAKCHAVHLRHRIIDHQHGRNGKSLALAGYPVDLLQVHRHVALLG
jgi:hypothetical protein